MHNKNCLPVCDDDPTYYYLDQKCYKVINVTATTWPAAARICNDDGATLPIFSPNLDLWGNDWKNWQTFQKWRYAFLFYIYMSKCLKWLRTRQCSLCTCDLCNDM